MALRWFWYVLDPGPHVIRRRSQGCCVTIGAHIRGDLPRKRRERFVLDWGDEAFAEQLTTLTYDTAALADFSRHLLKNIQVHAVFPL